VPEEARSGRSKVRVRSRTRPPTASFASDDAQAGHRVAVVIDVSDLGEVVGPIRSAVGAVGARLPVATCYQAPSRAIALQLATDIRAVTPMLPSALACFDDDFEACIAHLRLPETHRRFIRTPNLLERLFVEERRRLKIIPNGVGEKPVLKLLLDSLVRAAERWRGLRFTEFELRQIAAVRKELDQEYEASITPLARSPTPRVSSKYVP
jgi:hypothetical protein